MNVFSALIGFLLFIILVDFFVGLRRTNDLVRYLATNLSVYIVAAVLLLLFGPFFLLSPVKINHQVKQDGKITLVYPNDLAYDYERFAYLTKKAQDNVYDLYQQIVPIKFLLVSSNVNMVRYGSPPVAAARGLAGINVRFSKMDEGVLTHELSHHYLSQTTGRNPFYFPRWFDEGLATYLGDMDSMVKFTQASVLKNSLDKGLYQEDLVYWNGFTGHLRWLVLDLRARPLEAYTQSYFLVKFLADDYGKDNLRNLIWESKTSPSFEQAFQTVYQMSLDEFHQKFLQVARDFKDTPEGLFEEFKNPPKGGN